MTFSHTVARGFTLIELLLVIAIVGVLSAVLLISFSTTRQKGHDARRLVELVQMARAVQILVGSTAIPFAGCTTDFANVTTCTNPDLSKFTDPGGATAACLSGTPSGACQYSVARAVASGSLTTDNWQIKTMLMQGTSAPGLSAPGLACVSSANLTPFRIGCR